MSAPTDMIGVDSREQADFEAVVQHAFHGQPLEPEVARRVQERAAKVTEEIYRMHGELDDETIHNLLRGDEEHEP